MHKSERTINFLSVRGKNTSLCVVKTSRLNIMIPSVLISFTKLILIKLYTSFFVCSINPFNSVFYLYFCYVFLKKAKYKCI